MSEQQEKQPRPDMMVGHTYRVTAPVDTRELKVYITINSIDTGLLFKPYEIFLNCLDSSYFEHFAIVGLMISRQLQADVPIETIAKDLQQIHSPVTGHMAKGRGWVPSIYALVGEVLMREVGKTLEPTALEPVT